MNRVADNLIRLAAVLLPVGIVLSHRNVPIAFALIALTGLAALPRFRPAPWALALFGLALWALITCFWSPYYDVMAWPAYLLALGVLGNSAMLVGTMGQVRAIAYGAGAALVLLTVESLTGGLIRDLVPPAGPPDKDDIATARGITTVLSLVPGLMLMAGTRAKVPWRWLLVIAACAFICAKSFGVTANLLALLAAGGAAGLVWLLPRRGLLLVLVAAALPVLLMPLVAMTLPGTETMTGWETGPASWRMRLIAWKATWGGVTDGPLGFLFGHGVEGARMLGARLGEVDIPGVAVTVQMVPTHPHNVYLQVWFDLGLVGVGLALAAFALGARALGRASLTRAEASAVAALAAMAAIFALTDASLWTLWRVIAPMLGAWLIARQVIARQQADDKGCP